MSGVDSFDDAMFEKLSAKEENVVYSPIGVLSALGMIYAGAAKETATTLRHTFRSELSDEVFHSAMNRAALDLRAYSTSTKAEAKGVRIDLANATWADRTTALVPGYLTTLGEKYDAGVFLTDLNEDPSAAAKVINRWAKEHTFGKVSQLLEPSDLPRGLPLVLTSTLYFWASWLSPFDSKDTYSQQFLPLVGNPIDVPMMHATQRVGYAESDSWKMVELPYDGGRLSMWIVVPDPRRFAEVRSAARGPWLAELAKRLNKESVQLAIPRVTFDWGGSLKSPLSGLGMSLAFSSSADFSGISTVQRIYVGDVLARVSIALGEAGTEAVSATAVMAKSGAPAGTKRFAADSPFLFWIRDASGLPLFHGQVLKPSRD